MNIFKSLFEIFKQSNKNFLEKQEELILSWVSERSLCGKLAQYINDEIANSNFSNYHVDIEYNRNYWWKVKTIIDDDLKILNITCDIIVHSRWKNINQDNLIAIEMKKSSAPESEKTKDRNRLIALTKEMCNWVWDAWYWNLPKHVCWYILWIYYEIDINNWVFLLEIYKKWELFEKTKYNFLTK
jgi:hypothetical protein